MDPDRGPVERAARDAERVRGWLATDDRDFLVRVYAAIVTEDPRVERSPTCAVVPPAELAAWLEALPLQRGLNAERREPLVELIRLGRARPASRRPRRARRCRVVGEPGLEPGTGGI